jgi:predicted kinase
MYRAGLALDTRTWGGERARLYSADMTTRTYRSLLDSAETELALGRNVVLDATWGQPVHRTWASRSADRAHADLKVLQTTLPDDLAGARLSARAAEGTDASDADVAVRHLIAAGFAPWDAPGIDMRGAPDVALRAALDVVEV